MNLHRQEVDMTEALKALIVEDSEDDAHLLLRELRRGDYLVTFERVENAEQMSAALAQKEFDIVFADYSLPQFDAPRALELLKQSGTDIPFIIVSGTVAEDVAVQAMKAGAHDYLNKSNLRRLQAAVQRELREAQQRRAYRKADEALRTSEAQYRILFDSNPQPMWVYEARTLRFLAVNEAAIRHYGYSRNEFHAMTIRGIRIPETVPSLLRETTLDTESFSKSGLWKHRKKDGSLIDVELTSHGIVFNGKPAQLVLALDVTEKLKARYALQEKADELASMTQQLWHASKLVTMGELAASVAHELNNPLATVSLRVETLMGQLAHDEQTQRSLHIIMSEVERMANLVTNLLQFTRRNYRQISTIDVREELERSIDLISYYLRNRRIQVVREFDETLTPIHADRQQLRQVFLNLMTNAGDAMPEGGVLTVRANDQSDSLRVMIEFVDTGQGISSSDLQKVWEPFFTSKPEGKGTGLGLSICNRIVEEHGGTISLESEVGKGTTVRLALPVANGALTERSEKLVTDTTTVSTEAGPEAGTVVTMAHGSTKQR
ncbi:MAG TPA: ATP-binding protein [Pyrinomonadaceae bacterium]|nr:ATP-binding protein [Pyrinomonadaceae bacterium]